MAFNEWGSARKPITRSDMRLAREAATCRWGTPDEVKNEVLFRTFELISMDGVVLKDLIEAGKMLAAFDRVDIAAAEQAASKPAEDPVGQYFANLFNEAQA